jgi:hypothetical protein
VTARKGDPDGIESPDVEIGAVVKAKSLRFQRVPEVDVEFVGDQPREAASGSERENLPEEVEPDVTYTDVRVRWNAAAKIRFEGVDDD